MGLDDHYLPNNRMNGDPAKLRSFLAPLYRARYARRSPDRMAVGRTGWRLEQTGFQPAAQSPAR